MADVDIKIAAVIPYSYIESRRKMLLKISNTLISTLLVRKNVTSYSQNFLTALLQIGVDVCQALKVMDGNTQGL